jgi:ATP-binding cassette subfamily B protein
LIDDQNIAKAKQDSLRDSISVVPQDPILFHRSLKDNIAYGNPSASEEEILAASKMARCHRFIKYLPE